MGGLKEDSNINKHTNIFREFTIIIYTLQIRSDFIPLIYDVKNIQSLLLINSPPIGQSQMYRIQHILSIILKKPVTKSFHSQHFEPCENHVEPCENLSNRAKSMSDRAKSMSRTDKIKIEFMSWRSCDAVINKHQPSHRQ